MQLVKRSRYCWLLLTAWCLLAGAGLAQGPPLASLYYVDAFGLWHGCAPMRLNVRLSGDAADIDLTYERIRTLAESRLRAARLYGEYDNEVLFSSPLPFELLELPPSLHVNVGVLVSESGRNGAFSIDVLFRKRLRDVASDLLGFTATWNTEIFGMHGGDAGHILQRVSEKIDLFILEYLRVNETACQ